MSPTRDDVIVLIKTEIEKLDRSLNRWRDTTMPAYAGTIRRKQELQAELQRLESMPRQHVGSQGAISTREALLRPLLDNNGFSIRDWARTAGVDFHTANDFLKGKTNPYKSTRKKLADALGLGVEKLPE